jgi:hypothetical protein
MHLKVLPFDASCVSHIKFWRERDTILSGTRAGVAHETYGLSFTPSSFSCILRDFHEVLLEFMVFANLIGGYIILHVGSST